MYEKWLEDCCHPRQLSSHQGGENGRAKILQVVLLQVLRVFLVGGPIYRLIVAAAAPVIQPD